MDIDILQDPETVTVDTDAAIVLPCKDDAVNSISVLSSDLTPDLLQASSMLVVQTIQFRYADTDSYRYQE